MTVYVLMANGGHDGDALLGVYDTEDEADRAAADWQPPEYGRDYLAYVVECEVGAAPTIRYSDSAIS
jgi:hypothetical protein